MRKRAHVALVVSLCAVVAGACNREAREFNGALPARADSAQHVTDGALQLGRHANVHITSVTRVAGAPRDSGGEYGGNAYATSEGKRLFTWMNCSGCHANGGGGIGPPLMDAKWIYGSDPLDIYFTIEHGRPNGMPEFGARLNSQQIWQLVSYVRSMSGLEPKWVRPGRSDHMQIRVSEQQTGLPKP